MKQLTQNLKTGATKLVEVPTPTLLPGEVLIRTASSLVSVGTERMLVAFGKANWVKKAWMHPDRVRAVVSKIKINGLVPTLLTVDRKLEEPIPLGYSQVGRVEALGQGIHDLQLGDRVASNGAHAELVAVPRPLVAKIPDNVSDEAASFTVLGAIGLHALRLLHPTLGETVVVIGLGLVGMLTANLLYINGCKVIGVDLDPDRLAVAKARGYSTIAANIHHPEKVIAAMTNGHGADGVIIAASSQSDKVMRQAAAMCRKRGRIVLVGVVGLHLNRADFYDKELTFQVSCAYGPGRYDPAYEQAGSDYPLPYVRWTENRNFQSILHLLSTGQLEVESLITERVPLEEYQQIYEHIERKLSGAYLLLYPKIVEPHMPPLKIGSPQFAKEAKGQIGIIGAGQYTRVTLLPALKGLPIHYIASAHGLSADSLAKVYNIPFPISDYHVMLEDPGVSLVLITTRHFQHGQMVVEALRAGKHVFVEKPLALNTRELEQIAQAYQTAGGSLTVGYNRRFAPLIQMLKSMLPPIPLQMVATVNAGAVDPAAWTQDPSQGGGRILGEACHFIDLMAFLTDSPVDSVCMQALGEQPSTWGDNGSILLRFRNGSSGVLHYFSNGSVAYPKERLEVFAAGATWVLDNFKSLKAYGLPHFSRVTKQQDKGHAEQFRQLVLQVKRGGPALISPGSLFNTSYASLAALTSLRERRWVVVETLIDD